jgi:hypothetical protein
MKLASFGKPDRKTNRASRSCDVIDGSPASSIGISSEPKLMPNLATVGAQYRRSTCRLIAPRSANALAPSAQVATLDKEHASAVNALAAAEDQWPALRSEYEDALETL